MEPVLQEQLESQVPPELQVSLAQQVQQELPVQQEQQALPVQQVLQVLLVQQELLE